MPKNIIFADYFLLQIFSPLPSSFPFDFSLTKVNGQKRSLLRCGRKNTMPESKEAFPTKPVSNLTERVQ